MATESCTTVTSHRPTPTSVLEEATATTGYIGPTSAENVAAPAWYLSIVVPVQETGYVAEIETATWVRFAKRSRAKWMRDNPY
jgi:hypothetical protein